MQLNIQAFSPVRAALLILFVLALMTITWAVAAAVTVIPWPGGSTVQTADALNGMTIPPPPQITLI